MNHLATHIWRLAIGVLLGGAALLEAAPQERAFLDQYCVACHNQKLKTAGLTLDNADVEHVGDHADTWEKVVRKLHGGTMPPLGMRRPDSATLDSFASSLETALVAFSRCALRLAAPVGGLVVDRYNRRYVVMVAQIASMILAFALAFLTLTNTV